jgi:hypothetical protein
MFKFLMSFVFAVVLFSSPVLAGGGGGAKKDATIRFSHDITGAPAVVIIADPAAALRTSIQNSTATLSEITRAGGILVRPGETKSLKVKAGNVMLFGSIVDERNGDTDFFANGVVPVEKGKTVTVKASSLVSSSGP